MSTEVSNPLLAALKLPGRVFPLPSGGHFYDNGELATDVVNGEIHVMPMSGIAEMKFRSPDLLYSGKAVAEVIKECVPSILKPEKMISRDSDAILSYIRLVTYGPELDVKTIHNCKDAKEHSYTINLEKIISSIVPLSEDNYKMFFITTLPNGQHLVLTPLRWESAIELIQLSSTQNPTSEDIDKMYLVNTSGMVQSIDGIVDRKLIDEWTKLLPAPYSKQIQNLVTKGLEVWNANFESKVKCKDCGEEITVPIDLNPSSFFSQ